MTSATRCGCGYEISADEVRAYLDEQALCEGCLDAPLTPDHPETP